MIIIMKILIVTGMSGSGKSQVLNALEDIGYYCIDNLPPQLLLNLSEFRNEMGDIRKKIAVTMDCRSKNVFPQLNNVLNSFKKNNIEFSTLFLECDNATLLKRYKETRRTHPLMNEMSKNLEGAIKEEREIIAEVRSMMNYLIDTTLLSTSQLKSKVVDLFADEGKRSMKINFVSFGYKFGILADADLVFDVRCLPNPYYVEGLREKTGETQEVRDFVMGNDKAQGLLGKIKSYLEYSVPLYISEGKSQLVVGIGCTGGKHRSVTFVHLLTDHFSDDTNRLLSSHRDIVRV